jgi:hypothetical protein
MKLFKVFAIVLLAHTLLSSTCSKEDDNGGTTGTIAAGAWRVTVYWDNNADESNKFSGYSFEFKANGQLSATKAGSTVNGTWTETSSKLIIDFGTTPILEKLNDDWLRVEKTNTSIRLKDDNPAKDERLEFVKN